MFLAFYLLCALLNSGTAFYQHLDQTWVCYFLLKKYLGSRVRAPPVSRGKRTHLEGSLRTWPFSETEAISWPLDPVNSWATDFDQANSTSYKLSLGGTSLSSSQNTDGYRRNSFPLIHQWPLLAWCSGLVPCKLHGGGGAGWSHWWCFSFSCPKSDFIITKHIKTVI